jgi:UDP-2,3-diacylglucosamine pyrophosphatase LpxH
LADQGDSSGGAGRASRSRIAEQARSRIELVASRIPGARALVRPALPEAVADRLVIVSDIHFGNDWSALVMGDNRLKLVEGIRALGPIDELVLLGDIFDFWTTTLGDALEQGRELFKALFKLDNVGRMIFIPGNHDHHVVRLHYAEQVSKRLRAGDLEPPELTIPMMSDCPAFEPLKPEGATVPLFMTYPWHQVEVRGRTALLTHGHLLGFFERSLWRPKRRFLNAYLHKRNPSVDLNDMEAFLSPYYEMLSLSTAVPGVVDSRYRFYRIVSRTAKVLGFESEYRVSSFRDTTIEQNAVEIETLLDHFFSEKPDYFIYGHTHRPGALDLPLSGTLAVNTGGWFNEPNPANNPGYTIIEVTDTVRIIELGKPGEPEVAEELHLDPRRGSPRPSGP